jgi:putative NIF3 family GTP cyclohydrolase 1 type 2
VGSILTLNVADIVKSPRWVVVFVDATPEVLDAAECPAGEDVAGVTHCAFSDVHDGQKGSMARLGA